MSSRYSALICYSLIELPLAGTDVAQRALDTWSTDDVATFIKKNPKWSAFVDNFIAGGVDGETLLGLEIDAMLEFVGGHRLIALAIHGKVQGILKKQGGSCVTPRD